MLLEEFSECSLLNFYYDHIKPRHEICPCVAFKFIERLIYHKLSFAQSVNHYFHEETITDEIHLWMKKLFSSRNYEFFTKDPESKNGSDYEIWISEKTNFLGFRFQAKIFKLSKYNKKDIVVRGFAHPQPKCSDRANKNNYQIQKLIQDSKLNKRIPFYNIYACSSHHFTGALLLFPQLLINKYTGQVKQCQTAHLVQDEILFNNLTQYIFPWSELFCQCKCPDQIIDLHCYKQPKNSLKDILDNLNQKLNNLNINHDNFSENEYILSIDSIPNYLKELINIKQLDADQLTTQLYINKILNEQFLKSLLIIKNS